MMLAQLGNVSLTSPLAFAAFIAALTLCVLGAGHALFHERLRHRTLAAAMGAAACTAGAWAVLEVWWKPFPDAVAWQVYAAGGCVAFVVFAALVQTGRRVLLAAAAALALACALGVSNVVYQQFPTVRSLDPEPQAVRMPYSAVAEAEAAGRAPRLGGEAVGALVDVDLDAKVSGFVHRPAVAYLPPVYFTDPQRRLPVVVLMAGNPGAPGQWFAAGGAEETLDAYQREHGGVSPIVVSVDATGTFSGNPICVDGPKDKVMTYLSVDVPAQLKQKFRVMEDTSRWTIGGLSYGGTCALQVVSNHPEVYGSFLDFSGQKEPTIGNRKDTVDRFFGGDEAAFRAVNPEDLLTAAAGTDKYRGIQGRFIAGEDDHDAVAALRHLNELARGAGIESSFATVPGGHNYRTWRVALRGTIDFIVHRDGLEKQ